MTPRFGSSTPITARALRAPTRAATVRQALVAALLASSAAAAQTQEPPRNLLALGAIAVPEFEGAEDKVAAPLLIGRLSLGRHGSLRIAGLGLQYNLLDDRNAWAFGPVLSFRPPRDADVDDEVVRRLREVDGTAEFGFFVEYGLRDLVATGDRLGVGFENKAGDGRLLTLSLSYQGAKQGAFGWGFDVHLTHADDEYRSTYFGIDADNSARSGLPQFSAGSGMHSVGIGLNLSHDLSREWTLLGRVGLSRLLGDARDSPLVQQRGNPRSASVGLALGYRF